MIAHSKSLPIFVLGIILLIGSCSKESRSVTEPEQSLHTFGSLEGYLRRALPYTGGVPYATVEIAGRTVASAPSTPYESWYYVDSIPVGRQSVTVRHPAFESFTPSTTPNHDWKNRMRESRSYGSVGEPVGNHRLYPEEAGGEIPPPTRLDAARFIVRLFCSAVGE